MMSNKRIRGVRMYLPRKEILDGTWRFPEPIEVK